MASRKRTFEDVDFMEFDSWQWEESMHETPRKKRRINPEEEIQHGISELKIQEPGIYNPLHSAIEWKVYCSHSKRDDLLKCLQMERDRKFKSDICIYDPTNCAKIVVCSGKPHSIRLLHDTLKRVGFRWKSWSGKQRNWVMDRFCFINDYDLFIGQMLETACFERQISLSVFDFDRKSREQHILNANINLFLDYKSECNEIRITSMINNDGKKALEEILTRYKYRRVHSHHHNESGMEMWSKIGVLHPGHVLTWKEYTMFYKQWVLGVNEKAIVDVPSCKCGKVLTLHRVKKEGSNFGRKFYNCNVCARGLGMRTASFIWADGEVTDKVSDLFIDNFVTDKLTQITLDL